MLFDSALLFTSSYLCVKHAWCDYKKKSSDQKTRNIIKENPRKFTTLQTCGFGSSSARTEILSRPLQITVRGGGGAPGISMRETIFLWYDIFCRYIVIPRFFLELSLKIFFSPENVNLIYLILFGNLEKLVGTLVIE